MNGIADRAWERLHELYAHDAIVEHPFALPSPTRTAGRDAIRQHFASFAAAPLRLEVRNVLVHQTADPEVAITGDALASASAAALAAVGGGTVTQTEVGDEESHYEVEVTFADGHQVDVQLDENFALVTTIPDGSGG